MINVGLIGFGYWGPNLARNFNFNQDLQLSAVCDFSENRIDSARRFLRKMVRALLCTCMPSMGRIAERD